MSTARISLCLAALLTAILPFKANAATKKPVCTVRFHVQVRATEQDPFSVPIAVPGSVKKIYIESTPTISERQIDSIYPFETPDGTWGCLFQLDNSGRIDLSNITAANRGRLMILFLGSQTANRQVQDILIDQPVNDGRIAIMRGFAPQEIELLKKRFKTISPSKTATPPVAPFKKTPESNWSGG